MDSGLITVIKQAKEGSHDAFREIAGLYSPLIESLVKAAVRKSAAGSLRQTSRQDNPAFTEYEDLRQEAVIALYNAVLSFNVAQENITFGLYSKICIKNRLISALKKIRTREYEAPEIPLQVDPADRLIEKEALETLFGKINISLTEMEKSIFKLYIGNMSYREIALALGKSVKSVDNAIYRIKIKLKKLI